MQTESDTKSGQLAFGSYVFREVDKIQTVWINHDYKMLKTAVKFCCLITKSQVQIGETSESKKSKSGWKS